MGKKAKTGKHRLDIFYKKAKEAGYRARAAYKLMQLNKKFEFLQKSKVCVDLCAAPGSWMQVASKYMPPSSVIVGVDLFPIKAIPNTLSIVGDITTEKVRQDLKATLKTWSADLVLHDGAPNVGQNWLHDAYQQNLLVLHAFKLACELLQKGGTFVSKVFRSKDYFSLEYIFRKLFKKVEATKPQASRLESAEIFVVCSGYLKPDRVDPEFFDPKSVFQEINPEPDNKINLLKPEKTRRKAEGYEEGVTLLYKPESVSSFISSAKYLHILQESSALKFDTDEYLNNPHTTDEIKEYCNDIKVLGRREIRVLLNWRKKIRADTNAEKQEQKEKELQEKIQNGEIEEHQMDELDELDEIKKQAEEIRAQTTKEEKKKRKKVQKERKKLQERMNLKMIIPGDVGPVEKTGDGLFSLKTLDKAKSLDAVVDQEAEEVVESSSEEENDDVVVLRKDGKKRKMQYMKDGNYLDKSGRFYKTADETDSDEESEYSDSDREDLGLERTTIKPKKGDKKSVSFNLPDVDEDDDCVGATNPLVTDLIGDKREVRREMKAEGWFSKDIFQDLETEVDEDMELEASEKLYQRKGGKIATKEDKVDNKESKSAIDNGYHSSSSDVEKALDAPETDSDSDSDSDSEDDEKQPQLIGSSVDSAAPMRNKKGKKRKGEFALDPVGKALGTKMIESKKAKRDIMDAAWNRYMFGDEDHLPEWFVQDEQKHNQMRIEVDPEDLKMYREQEKNVDARSIKKVVEAKARKQRRMKKRMEKAKKKAEVVTENQDMNSREKALELKKIYKKALAPTKKKDKTYVVMKKSYKGRKPVATKGPYRMVDKRLKKDTKSQERARAKASKNKRKR